ncbi:MAG: DUF4091 domain-containing protein [Flavobacteriaceae bacterium]
MRTLITNILFSLPIFILCCGCTKQQNPTKSFEKDESLDNIESVPNWLKLNVEEILFSDSINVWVPSNNFQTSSLIKVPRFPRKFTKAEFEKNESLKDFEINPLDPGIALELSGVRNEQVSAQIAMGAKADLSNISVEINNLVSENNDIFKKENIEIRYVKYVPVQKARSEYVWSAKLEDVVGEEVSGTMTPFVVADALIEMDTVDVPAYRAQPVWFTFHIPKNSKPGTYNGDIVITSKKDTLYKHHIKLHILNPQLPDVKDYKFHLDLWLNPSAIAGYYNMEHWSDTHWKMISKYMEDYASRGGKNVTTVITHEPWHKPWVNNTTISQSFYGYKSMVKWIKTTDGKWEFDYSVFDKYVSLAHKAGITGAINAYSMTPFLTKQKIHYLDKEDNKQKIIEIDVEDSIYKELWTSFLISFKNHLKHKGWLEKTYLGFDEKSDEVMRIIYGIIENSAPEFLEKTVIAGHPGATKFAENLSISYTFFPLQSHEKEATVPVIPTIEERKKNNRLTTFYLCGAPDHPNTLTYSPAIESRLIPWLALKYNTDGYLRWAYNNWTDDPYKKPVFFHNPGDDNYVYPGKNGPVSSIRWELLKEGIEDYELFRLAKQNSLIPIEQLNEAVEFATRNQDGRYKKTDDMVKARNLILTDE